MRIAIAQLNYTVGDLEGNAAKILDAGQKAAEAGARLLVTSELAICGYPPLDLLNQQGFVQDCVAGAAWVAGELDIALLIGSPWHRGMDGYKAEPLPEISIEEMADSARHLHNSALLFDKGELKSVVHKRLLPTYDVFDERRWFSPGTGLAKCSELDGVKLGVHICEDGWNALGDEAEQSPESHFRRYFDACDPIAELVNDGANLLVNLSASPWRIFSEEGFMPLGLAAKIEHENIDIEEHGWRFLMPRQWERRLYFNEVAKRAGVPYLFVNQVGANDSLIFDGSSLVAHPDGQQDLGPADFLETVEVFDHSGQHVMLDKEAGTTFPCPIYSNYPTSEHHRFFEPEEMREDGDAKFFRETELAKSVEDFTIGPEQLFLQAALEMGVRDYIRKTGHEKVIIGLSGGIDSALVTTIACHAIGPENVRCIGMPTRFSSEGSISDSEELCKNLGCAFEVYPIEDTFGALEGMLKGTALRDSRFARPQDSRETSTPLEGLALENIQPRIRGTILMALANQSNSLVLAPGNKSELAVGYSTLYGDTVGCLEVIGDLYKTEVWRLSRFYNRAGELIPKAIIEKEPSAELRDDQRDTDSLPDYGILDPILRLYIDHAMAVCAIIEMSDEEGGEPRFDAETVRKVCRMVDIAEFKRKQSPMVLRVSSRAFGLGRQMPAVNGYRPS